MAFYYGHVRLNKLLETDQNLREYMMTLPEDVRVAINQHPYDIATPEDVYRFVENMNGGK
jgi:hypothetical protein